MRWGCISCGRIDVRSFLEINHYTTYFERVGGFMAVSHVPYHLGAFQLFWAQVAIVVLMMEYNSPACLDERIGVSAPLRNCSDER